MVDDSKPWEFSASGWLGHTGVYEPAIFDHCSPSQYAGMGKQQKRAYDKRRSQEWDASIKAKQEWRKLVAEAYERGEISEETPSLSQEAKSVIFWFKEEKAKQEILDQEKKKAEDLSVEKFRQAQALKKSEFAKWWVEHSPRRVEGFDHVLKNEANIFWRAVHGEVSKAIQLYVLREVAEIKEDLIRVG